MWPGNTADVKTLIPIVKRMRERFRLREITVVADRGMVSQATLEAFEKSEPPVRYIVGVQMRRQKELNTSVLGSRARWFAMALLTFGLAAEWRTESVAFNCLWPKTVIQTAALALLPGIDPRRCRKPEIVADAAHAILLKDAATFTGRFCVDEDVLREAGITDFRPYAVDPEYPLIADLFLG